MPLIFKTISVTSSRIPSTDENSWRTLSICTAVIADPCREDNKTLLNAFPNVKPKPRSSGSATTTALLGETLESLVDRELGLINSCQFLWIIFPPFSFLGFDPKYPSTPEGWQNHRTKINLILYSSPFWRPATVMSHWCNVTNWSYYQSNGWQGSQSGLATRTWALNFNL